MTNDLHENENEPLDSPLAGVVGDSPAMCEIFRLTRLVAPTRASVLIVGETGTGKEMIARALHRLSRRADGPYVRVNCGALAESLLESELFGHVKGAFTGAVDNKTGRFEAAHGGTIFLDEISTISPKLQVKLLRVLQEREFERVGESRTIRVDTRVVAATNQSLEDAIETGHFRDDLYYRLNVVPIFLPPLRQRRSDIAALTRFFLERYCQENRRLPGDIPPEILKGLQEYDWPGNVRELENYCERAVVLAHGDEPIDFGVLVPPKNKHRGSRQDLDGLVDQLVQMALRTLPPGTERFYDQVIDRVERRLLEEVMGECDQVMIKAAARLGMNRNTLTKKLSAFEHPPEENGATDVAGTD
jgi:transcriptional regulator with GAF, ATPase, and Fis domain